jgi:aspartate carbamoyltransferase regulatory subunit
MKVMRKLRVKSPKELAKFALSDKHCCPICNEDESSVEVTFTVDYRSSIRKRLRCKSCNSMWNEYLFRRDVDEVVLGRPTIEDYSE